MEYVDFSAGQPGQQDAADDLASVNASAAAHYNPAAAYEPPKQPPYLTPNFPSSISCDIKPRLTKEQHDILEAHFQKQHKPNTNTKKSFAESLNVSLDKVNNWFQNRRAKLKQDAKKQQGSLNLYHGPNHPSSDGETSPNFVDTTSQYHAMMQQWSGEMRAANALGISHPQSHPSHDQISPQALVFPGMGNAPAVFSTYNSNGHLQPDSFSSQEDLNRRTLTQEQFDAMGRSGGVMSEMGNFDNFETSFHPEQAAMDTVFADFGAGFKQQCGMDTYPIGPPMTSYDSTIPSNVSAESLHTFPSSTQMLGYANMSASSSEWSDSRSSSIHDGAPHAAATSQWQPGQSIPVDACQQQEEFRQVAARAGHARTSPHHPAQDRNMPWSDDSLARRGSSASLIQSMGDVGIQTPPLPQNGNFKSPAPPSNIAARRQRAPRPAALGVAALRSQSHSGAVQPSSPNGSQQPQPNPADQSLRRIRSSNYLGNFAHGRVMKSTPGSAQRSPLNFTFAEAMNSPQAMRSASAQSLSSLAPPTPLSPKGPIGVDETGQLQPWQAVIGNTSRQASIAETDVEHAESYQGMAAFPGQVWGSSPPVTPAFHQHQFFQTRLNGHPIMENTPPQSAPASQTCFQRSFFSMPPQMPQVQAAQPHHVPSQPLMPQPQVAAAMAPPPHQTHYVNSDSHFSMHNVAFAPVQTVSMAADAAPPQGIPFHFANGVPITNAEGNIELMFPSPVPATQPGFMHQPAPPSQGHTPPQQFQHVHTPPQITYPFIASTGSSPASQGTSHLSKSSSSDFFVHEYSPPAAVKRGATPRKGPVDTVPKNYAFANTGPEHFEEKKNKKADSSKDSSTSSDSPASSSETAFTSTF